MTEVDPQDVSTWPLCEAESFSVPLPPGSEIREHDGIVALYNAEYGKFCALQGPVLEKDLRVMSRSLGGAIFDKLYPGVFSGLIRAEARALVAREELSSETKELFARYKELNPASSLA